MTLSTATVRSPWPDATRADDSARWLPIAEAAAAVLAEGALQRDRENASPREALEVLRSAGLANLLVPVEEGGHGASWDTAFAVLRVIARAAASLGLILGYHSLNQACIAFYGTDSAVRERWYRRTAENERLWSDSFNPVSPDLSFAAEGD